MDNVERIDLHTASVVLKTKIIQLRVEEHYSQYSNIPINCRRTNVAAARVLSLCPVTVCRQYYGRVYGGPTLRYTSPILSNTAIETQCCRTYIQITTENTGN